jgi:hypothetical protein
VIREKNRSHSFFLSPSVMKDSCLRPQERTHVGKISEMRERPLERIRINSKYEKV